MGAKTALLAFGEGDLCPTLFNATRVQRVKTAALVGQLHPGCVVESAEDATLYDCLYPPDGIVYATALAGGGLFCNRRLVLDHPSQLPEHFRKVGADRRIIMHGMNSALDSLVFAVWEHGTLIRSLSVSPDGGIQENIGEPFDFELPYWAGEHPVEPVPGWPEQDPYPFGPYPLPFNPLELGEDALRALFGFTTKDCRDPRDIDAASVHVHGFRIVAKPGAQQVLQEATHVEADPTMRTRALSMLGTGTIQR